MDPAFGAEELDAEDDELLLPPAHSPTTKGSRRALICSLALAVVLTSAVVLHMSWGNAGLSRFETDCAFALTYPRQHITYKLKDEKIVIDGNLDDPAWAAVEWSEDFVDITDAPWPDSARAAMAPAPRYRTRVKIRWDDQWLYVAASLQDEAVWANISHTCHCKDPKQDQVIFHDNDFEIFIDPAGSTESYKEFEMNAANQTWDLVLNHPYRDGGFENSSRVFGDKGWDMQPPLRCGTQILPSHALNNPKIKAKGWTAEVALPIEKLMESNPGAKRPSDGGFWRINFSRVQYQILVWNNKYIKNTNFSADNWVWSPQGLVDMHLPERWGFLQFSTQTPGSAKTIWNPEWSIRQVLGFGVYAWVGGGLPEEFGGVRPLGKS